jgi:hypothetical protein
MLRALPSSWVVLLLSLALSACSGNSGEKGKSDIEGRPGADGGKDSGSQHGDDDGGGGGDLGGGDEDGGTDPDLNDGSTSLDADSDGSSGSDGGADSSVVCKIACAADDCGELVSNNCGGFLKCPKVCPEGQGCGLVRPDKCDMPPSICTPRPAVDVCAGKCGVVSDGCSSVYVCNGSNGGVSCSGSQRCVETEGDAARNTCVAVAPSCVPKTCAEKNVACGPASDDCGNILDCTAQVGCASGKVCGTGANTGKCIDPPPPACVAKGIVEACTGSCGIADDGCGQALDCEASPLTKCPSGQTCGGGTTAGVCGSGGGACTQIAVATACANKCGTASDGCGGVYSCNTGNGGASCNSNLGEECILGVCTAPVCQAKSTAEACPGGNGHKSCGPQSDGCGKTLDCGGCTTDEACGLGGPSLCGALPTCQPASCAGKCGTMADGCGGTITCTPATGGVACMGAEFCGATQANRCGTPPVTCSPKTCAQLGHSCGLATDGCGHGLNCWPGCAPTDLNCNGSCGTNNACISNGVGAQSCVTGTPACTGSLCNTVPTNCAANAPTKLSGTVRTPGRLNAGTWYNQLPVPNAIVYIPADPNAALPTVFEGVAAGNAASCGRCEDEKLVADGQSVLAAAVTNYKGEFTLEGRIPVGVAFKVVVKVGKWRRVVQVPAGTAVACTPQALATDLTRLPATSTDGLSGTHLPKIAISTGKVDEMECVFRSIGFDDSEFTAPTGSGRISMYRANGAKMRVGTTTTTCTGNYNPPGPVNLSCTSPTAPVNGNGCTANLAGCNNTTTTTYTETTVADSTLYGSQAELNKYDVVVWDCEGGETFEGRCSNDGNKQCASANDCRTCSNNSARYCTADSGCKVCSNDSTRSCTDNNGCTGTGTCGGTATCGAATGKTCDTDNATRVRNYVDAGGRMFASHFSYTWIENNGTLDASADWGMGGSVDDGVGFISLPTGPTARTQANGVKGPLLRDWLGTQNALTSTSVPQFPITDPRDRAGANAGGSTDEWVYRNVRFCSNSSSRQCTVDSGDMGCSVCSNDSARACEANGDCQNGGTCGGINYCSNSASRTCASANNCRVCSHNASVFCTVNSDCGGTGRTCLGATATCGAPTCKAALNPRIQQLSFNTPYAAAETAICGRVAYSGFHVANASDNSNSYFPGICTNTGELSAQEKVLAFMLFDLATCVSAGDPPTPPSCQAKTAADVCPGVNDACGYVADGCGGVVDCAGCASGFYCDGNICRTQQCTPATCASLGYNCGTHADGCGGIARDAQGVQSCGDCTGGQLCGLGGPGLCGNPSCTPIPVGTACPANSCGTVSNGCGGTYNCGICATDQVCGGGGANKCGNGTCTQIPQATACATKNCGFVSDGCGGSYECGTCLAPDSCGGGGQANVCGHPQCTPFTKEQACNGKQCGWVSDGCGGAIQCGTCPGGGVCGGAGPNLCGNTCNTTSCNAKAAECGAIADECGGVLNCGNCPVGQTCGAGGANKCGTGQTCTARTCAQAGAQCGLVGDGCGAVLDCGGCTMPGQTCGGAGQANQCGTGTGGCNKLTCSGQSVQCGAASDGCGGLLDCGGCSSGYTCERSKCEMLPPILL